VQTNGGWTFALPSPGSLHTSRVRAESSTGQAGELPAPRPALRQVTPGQLLPELLSGSGTPIWTRPSYSGAGTVGQGPLRVDIAGSCVAFCGIRVTWSNGQAADTSALDVYALDGTRLWGFATGTAGRGLATGTRSGSIAPPPANFSRPLHASLARRQGGLGRRDRAIHNGWCGCSIPCRS